MIDRSLPPLCKGLRLGFADVQQLHLFEKTPPKNRNEGPTTQQLFHLGEDFIQVVSRPEYEVRFWRCAQGK